MMLFRLIRNIAGFLDWLIERHDHNERFRLFVEQHEQELRNG